MTWQPIETAPHNAELLLLVSAELRYVAQGCWYGLGLSGLGDWIDVDGRVVPVTHWMPIPAFPAKET